jgi:hypothetical protein
MRAENIARRQPVLAVHRQYTLLVPSESLHDLGERPGPCKYYVNFAAALLSRR